MVYSVRSADLQGRIAAKHLLCVCVCTLLLPAVNPFSCFLCCTDANTFWGLLGGVCLFSLCLRGSSPGTRLNMINSGGEELQTTFHRKLTTDICWTSLVGHYHHLWTEDAIMLFKGSPLRVEWLHLTIKARRTSIKHAGAWCKNMPSSIWHWARDGRKGSCGEEEEERTV